MSSSAEPAVTHHRREPEAHEVYALGHYEQMIVAKAIAFAASGGRDEDVAPTVQEAHDLWTLSHIFDQPGVLTVIKAVAS